MECIMKENNPRFTDVSEEEVKEFLQQVPSRGPIYSPNIAIHWLSGSHNFGMLRFGTLRYRTQRLFEKDVCVREEFEGSYLVTNSKILEEMTCKVLAFFAKNVSSLQTLIFESKHIGYDAWTSIIDNAPKLHTIDCRSLEGERLVLRNVPLSNVLFSGNNLKHLDLENTCVNFSCDKPMMFDSIRMVNSKITISGQCPVFAKKIVADRKVSEIFSTESQILRSEDMSSVDWGRFFEHRTC